MQKYKVQKIDKDKTGRIDIMAEITSTTVDDCKNKAIKSIGQSFEVPGFRKGKVPKDILEDRINTKDLLQETVDIALQDVVPQIFKDNKITPISRPQVSVTKLAFGNPLEFKIRVYVTPEIKLPNYNKVASNIVKSNARDLEISKEEVQQVISDIQNMKKEEDELPELTDEFVKKLGKFESVDDFKAKIKDNIKSEKEIDQKRRIRELIAEELVNQSQMEIPEEVVDMEFNLSMKRLEEELKNKDKSLKDYLKQINKTQDELDKEQRNYIKRQLKTRFILDAIAQKEDVTVTKEEVELQVQILRQRQPDLNEDYVSGYVEKMIINEKVLQYLESNSEKQN